MKQYRAALCDLRRTPQSYREDRILLRKPGANATASGDVQSLLALAPDDAVFSSAQASPDRETVLTALRVNLLELKPTRQEASWSAAPAAVSAGNAGSASELEERIDVAPVIVMQSDPYEPLRSLIGASQASALLQVYSTRAAKDTMFVGVDRAVVLQSPSPWSETAIESALSSALRPSLTASQLGIEWSQHQGTSGTYSALTGQVPLYLAVRDQHLFLTSSESLLVSLLSRRDAAMHTEAAGVTYAAAFQHTPHEQQVFRKLVSRLDAAGHNNTAAPKTEDDAETGNGQSPPFFSGNIASLSRMFAHVARESIEERDQGAQVTQTVIYQWQKP
jgi:hypothetical protein